ncbi:MAG: SPW repeat protein [Rhizobiales bacterium]|nr:SPW repeat protein [Hyphomicrobiales bacterium]
MDHIRRNAALCDAINLMLGAILFLSPWLYGFAPGLQTQNSVVSGIVIVVLSIAAFTAFAKWEEWLNLVLGLWVVVSPWVLGFAGTTAMWIDVVIGGGVALLAAIELWIMHRMPPEQTVSR